MKTVIPFASIIILAFAYHFTAHKSQERHKLKTIGAQMEIQSDKVAQVASRVNFNYSTEPYNEISKQLGIKLYWDTLNPKIEDALAYAFENEIYMQIGVTHPCIKSTFFHEIGHILMGHHKSNCKKDYWTELEVEADYFAYYVLGKNTLASDYCLEYWMKVHSKY